MNRSILEKYDSQKMYEIYDKWPEIAKKSYESNIRQFKISKINHIVFAGMGGSGTIGDIFAAIFPKSNIHVNVVKGYTLPKTISKDSLIVVISISGNTKETLSILKSAKKFDCKTISFSSGGKIIEYCKRHKLEFRKIDMVHSPRASLPSFLYSMLWVLEKVIPIDPKEITESIKTLEKIQKCISSNNLNKKNQSLVLAKWISGIPLIYYPAGLQSASIRFKNSLQENMKIHSIVEDIIEASHNGIMSWETKSNVKPIIIRGPNDNKKTKERWRILKEYFKENKIEFREIISVKGNILTKLIYLIFILDYTSIYGAILNNKDPSPIKSINFIKHRLH